MISELLDIAWDAALLVWELIKFLFSMLLVFVALAIVCCFIYSIFAAPLVAIAICAVAIMFKVVFR